MLHQSKFHTFGATRSPARFGLGVFGVGRSEKPQSLWRRCSSAWLEQRSFKPTVRGSNPRAGTTFVFNFGPQPLRQSPQYGRDIGKRLAYGLAMRSQIRTREQRFFRPLPSQRILTPNLLVLEKLRAGDAVDPDTDANWCGKTSRGPPADAKLMGRSSYNANRGLVIYACEIEL